MIAIRAEAPADHERVREVNRRAFGRGDEGALVDAVREQPGNISLVAAGDDGLVGHILFTPVRVDGPGSGVKVAGLGPMAVLPAQQRRGIGSRLVQEGLEQCRQLGYDAVVVLGHPRFYPRFGFVPASRHALRYEAPAPDDAFMVLPLRAGALGDRGGVVRYLPEFRDV